MNGKDRADLAARMMVSIVKDFNFGLDIHKDGSLAFIDVNSGDRYKISTKDLKDIYDKKEVEE